MFPYDLINYFDTGIVTNRNELFHHPYRVYNGNKQTLFTVII